MNGRLIRVDAAGLLTTVQDLGRPGYAHFGVSAAGAADSLAFRIGNRLAGNEANAPALEMTITGGTFTFTFDAVVAITGGECGEAPAWTPFPVAAGRRLRLRAVRSGARMYLCVRGGIDVQRVLGSASTDLASGLGGRAMRAGDVLRAGSMTDGDPLWAGLPWRPVQDGVLRATPGTQAGWFGPEFWQDEYSVAPESNRSGIRLRGAVVSAPQSQFMLTEGVTAGAVQIPPGGSPIVLSVDQQTTGGYPKIATVIAADLWKLGQLRPGDRVRFEGVTTETALQLLREQEARIAALDD